MGTVLANLALFLIIQLSFLRVVSSKKFDIPSGWQVRNNNVLQESKAADGTGRYRLLQVSNEQLLSQDGSFGLSFFSYNSSGQYYLALIMGISSFTNASASGACVWAANRDNPVGENATVHVTHEGALQLVDWNGKPVWNSPAGVSRMELQESGNLLLYNSTGGVLWQSFEHPTDVLLEGQSIKTGQSLISSMNSSTLASGNFKVVVEPSGLIFFLSFSSQPYLVWNLWNGNLPADVTSTRTTCPSYITVVQYASGELSMSFQAVANTSSSICGPPLSAGIGNGSSEALHYLRLHTDGRFVPYVYNSEKAVWEAGAPFMVNRLGSCVPLSCETGSVCSGSKQCSCIEEGEASNQSNTATCSSLSSRVPLMCNHELEAENHHFLNVSGAGYFSNNYTKADKISNLDDCWKMCLSNCSCSALFYNKLSRSCFFMDHLYGGLTADPTFDGFLKMQNSKLVLSKKRQDSTVAIGVGVTAGTVVLCSIVLTILLVWKRKLDSVTYALAAALQGSVHRFSYKELSLATGNFSSLVGRGGYGSVFEGVLADGRKVAIKRLESSSQGHREFISEVTCMGGISHVNIVQLYGFCAEKKHLMLVYEFVANGSLDKWLFDEERCLEWTIRCSIALEVARGLAYLHEESRQLIIHLDIKPQNILLDEKFTAKVSDFGMSKLLLGRQVSHAVTSVRGTPGYLAPEWLLHSIASKKCDVFSYGMLLLELIGGRRNFGRKVDEHEAGLSWYFPAWVVDQAKKGEFLEVVDARVRDNAREQEVEKLVYIAMWCIQQNPVDRPSMDAVVQMLEGRKETVQPPYSFHFALQSPGILTISNQGISICEWFQDSEGREIRSLSS